MVSDPAIDASRAAREALRSGWRDSEFYPPVTIADAIETGAATSPDDLMIFSAVDGDEHAATLSEIQRAAAQLAGRLAAAGIGAGDAVIIQAAADGAKRVTVSNCRPPASMPQRSTFTPCADASIAARNPAPPAPMTSTSCSTVCISVLK